MPFWPFKSAKRRKKVLGDFLEQEKKQKSKKLKELGEAFKEAAGDTKKFVDRFGATAK